MHDTCIPSSSICLFAYFWLFGSNSRLTQTLLDFPRRFELSGVTCIFTGMITSWLKLALFQDQYFPRKSSIFFVFLSVKGTSCRLKIFINRQKSQQQVVNCPVDREGLTHCKVKYHIVETIYEPIAIYIMRYSYLKPISETLMTQISSGHSEKRTMCFTHKKSCRCNQSNYCEQCFLTSEN